MPIIECHFCCTLLLRATTSLHRSKWEHTDATLLLENCYKVHIKTAIKSKTKPKQQQQPNKQISKNKKEYLTNQFKILQSFINLGVSQFLPLSLKLQCKNIFSVTRKVHNAFSVQFLDSLIFVHGFFRRIVGKYMFQRLV